MATFLGRFQNLAKPAADWALADPVLLLGEFGVSDPGATLPILKVGDGVRPFSALPSITAGGGGGGSADYVVGTTTTLAPGASATVVINNGVDPPTISFGIPEGVAGAEGDPGPANSLAIGTVTTGAAGSSAAATITGTPPAQTLNLTIPTGATGATGADGPTGPPGPSAFADPSVLVGLTVVNGSGTNAMRADGAPALSQAIVPTWTGAHTFNATVNLAGPLQMSGADGVSGQVLASQGAGLPAVWRNPGGGSIDLIFAFTTVTTAADPGAQKVGLNASTYAAATAIHFDITSQTNFDASTILTLLTQGNRIYMQQRNDASRAAIYQVNGAATNNSGWFSVPVTLINSLGSLFANNADITCVFMLSTSAESGANPTAQVGLTAVNGSLLTYMRSDAAPALSQAIAPTWSGVHTWSLALRAPDGAVGTPAYTFANDLDTGIFRLSANTACLGAGGVETLAWDNSAVYVRPGRRFYIQDGAAATPGLAFDSDSNTGIWRAGSDQLTITAGGVSVANFVTSGIGFNVQLQPLDGSVGTPAYSFGNDVDTGFYRNGADTIGVACAGIATMNLARSGGASILQMAINAAGGIALWTNNRDDSQSSFRGGTTSNYGHIQLFGSSYANFAGAVFIDAGNPGTGGTNDGHIIFRVGAGVVALRIAATQAATFSSSVTAASFNATSARAVKRETGAPRYAADILARLRPILYRLLAGESREQLGLIAEEVREVCPQLSDGNSVSYDRLAILLLADWQDRHAAAA